MSGASGGIDVSVLGVVEASSSYVEGFGWFNKSRTKVVRFLDWTIDGVPLRTLVGHDGVPAQETTSLFEERRMRGVGLENLSNLLGEDIPDPHFDTRFDDGRVALLFCLICADLGCQSLSAEVAIKETTVQWRDIGWQADYLPFNGGADQDDPVFTTVFDRAQYDSLLRSIRSDGWLAARSGETR